jgi:uncharacterized protein YceK
MWHGGACEESPAAGDRCAAVSAQQYAYASRKYRRRNDEGVIGMQKRAAAMAIVVLALGGCGAVSTFTHGFQQAKATGEDLQAALGSKPEVGFNWTNGVLTSVDVEFSEPPAGRTLEDIEAATRAAVAKEFEQRPRKIRLTFAVKP